jgi:hypothetical protein
MLIQQAAFVRNSEELLLLTALIAMTRTILAPPPKPWTPADGLVCIQSFHALPETTGDNAFALT